MAEAVTRVHEEPRWARIASLSSSILEGLAGVSALILALLGLVNVYPFHMLGVATILIGVALIFEGGAVASRMTHALREITAGKVEVSELGGGVSIEFLGGLIGLALGIIGLAGTLPYTLWPIAAIVFGIAHVLGSTVTARLRTVRYTDEPKQVQQVAGEAAREAADVQGLIGLAGIVLGILALIGYVPLILTLIAMFIFGFADLLRGPSMTARIMTRFAL